jgi:hypothetical protein
MIFGLIKTVIVMKSTMSDRLVAFIETTRLLDKEFAQKIGSSKQEISNWKAGQRISLRRIGEMLEAFPNLNGHWFLTGQGKMLTTGTNEEIEKKRICQDPDCIMRINNLENELNNLKGKVMELQAEKIELLAEKIKWLEKKK